MNPEITGYRMNAGVDPTVSIWQWEIPVYLFLGGLVAGLMVIGAIQELLWPGKWDRRLGRIGAVAGLVLLSLGMGALFLDLSHKLWVWRFYMAFKPASPMSWGAWILVLAYPAMALWFLGDIKEEEYASWSSRFKLLRLFAGLRSFAERHRKEVLITTALVGISLGSYTGVLLQTLMARPLWSTGLLAPLFLASGVSAGAAFYLLYKKSETGVKLALLRWDLAAIAIELGLLGIFILDKAAGTQIDREAISLLLAGPFTGAFVGLVLLGGILTPAIVEWRELRHADSPGWLAPILVLMGGLALRVVLVAAGQVSNYSMVAGG